MKLFKNVEWNIAGDEGTESILFIFHVNQINSMAVFTDFFPITMLPTNIKMAKVNPDILITGMKTDAALRIGFSYEDLGKYNFLSIDLMSSEVEQLRRINLKTKKIEFAFCGKRHFLSPFIITEKVAVFHPYVLDWDGILGATIIERMSKENLYLQNFEQIIDRLKNHIAKNPDCAGIYEELGRIYKIKGELETAKNYYLKEIYLLAGEDKKLSVSASRVINNLGVIYKNEKDFTRAYRLLKLAISLHKNYFEAYLSIAGLVEDKKLACACFARAYAMQTDDRPLVTALIEEYMQLHDLMPKWFLQAVHACEKGMDLSCGFPDFMVEDPFSFLQETIA